MSTTQLDSISRQHQLTLFQYKRWADGRTLAAIGQIDRSKYDQSFAFTLQQVNHMVIVEDLFRSRLEHVEPPHKATNSEEVPELETLGERLLESGGWYQNYVEQLSTIEQQQTIRFVFADGKPGSMAVGEILFHIINHGTYHRGAIAHALDLANVPHPVDGYGIFIHQQEPHRRR